MSFCIYLTHPEVNIDPGVPVPDWGLSELGRRRAKMSRQQPWSDQIRHVISSGERKAIETAGIFAAGTSLKVQIAEQTHENDRSATGFLPPAEFEEVADQFFAEPDVSVQGWERAIDAQHRIVTALEVEISKLPDADPLLITGHGGVGTLLLCHLIGRPITRSLDQKRGGSWYRFEKSDLKEQSAPALSWTELE